MAMRIERLERLFVFNGVKLPDPNPDFTVEQVRDMYVNTYPETGDSRRRRSNSRQWRDGIQIRARNRGQRMSPQKTRKICRAAEQVAECLPRTSERRQGCARVGSSRLRGSVSTRPNPGAIKKMSRSIPGRRTDRKNVRQAEVQSRGSRRRAVPSASRSGHSTPRLIGLPISVTVPSLKGLRSRYCSRWDEEPAAHLGKSLLRLGICRAEDWSGSAVDFVERGFRRFCKQNGADAGKENLERISAHHGSPV